MKKPSPASRIIGPILGFTVIIAFVAAFPSIMRSAGSGASASAETLNSAKTAVESVIVDQGGIKVTYTGMRLMQYLPGQAEAYALYVDLKIENDSGETVTIYPQDASVNGVMKTALTAVPMTVLNEKSLSAAFFFTNFDGTGIDSVNDSDKVSKVEFCVTARDDDFKEVLSSSSITVPK